MITRVIYDYKKIEGLLKEYRGIADRLEKGKGSKLDQDKKRFIERLLAGLPRQERMIIHIFYIEDRPWKEVSQIMEVTESWGRKIRRRAIEKMERIASI